MENNKEIFNMFNKNGNDNLSNLSILDQSMMRSTLSNYYLELRKTLNLDKNVLFGTEIEYEDAQKEKIEENVKKRLENKGWNIHRDDSLYNGAELVSPALTDTKETWIDLNTACNIVSENAKIVRSASGHIHICMNILGNNPKYWRNFAKLWMAYEYIIFRFLYGEYTSSRQQIEKYAKPISKSLIDDFERIEDRGKMTCAMYMMKVLNAEDDRRRSINFRNASNTDLYKYNTVADKNTIEFRSANGSFNPIIWQNNINLLVKLLEYAKNPNYNEDIINRRLQIIKEKEIPSNIIKYSRVYLNDPIELADLIFDNNLDKLYFLRQYYKDMQVGKEPLTKSKSFTYK